MPDTHVMYSSQEVGFATRMPLALAQQPEGFVVRRLQGKHTKDDRLWLCEQAEQPFGEGVFFSRELQALDKELHRIKLEVAQHFLDNATIRIMEMF